MADSISPAKFAHVVRKTTPERFQGMLAWYRTVLGARIVHGNDMLAFLTYDDEHHRVALIAMPGLAEAHKDSVGTDHIAFTYASLGDLLLAYERLRDTGITPVWCINHGPTVSMYYEDPDASRVELQIDVFATFEEADSWMKDSDFEQNPIGIMFDPDDLLERFKAGEPRASLVERRRLRDGESPFDHYR